MTGGRSYTSMHAEQLHARRASTQLWPCNETRHVHTPSYQLTSLIIRLGSDTTRRIVYILPGWRKLDFFKEKMVFTFLRLLGFSVFSALICLQCFGTVGLDWRQEEHPVCKN